MDLLESRFDPITEAIGFVEADPTLVAVTLAEVAGWSDGHRFAPLVDPVDGPIDTALARLDPLGLPSRYLVFGTRSTWTAVFRNDERYHSSETTGRLAQKLRCRAVFFDHVPDTHRLPEGRFGYTEFSSFPPDADPAKFTVTPERRVYVINDGGRWEFSTFGDPQPYEVLERYDARRLRDRLTPETLGMYGRALGIEIADADFYVGPAYVVSLRGGRLVKVLERLLRGPSLAKARRRYGLDTAPSKRTRTPRKPRPSGGHMTPLFEDVIMFANRDPRSLLLEVTTRAGDVEEAGGTIHAIDLNYEDAEGSASMVVTLTEQQARSLGYSDDDIVRMSQQEIHPDGT